MMGVFYVKVHIYVCVVIINKLFCAGHVDIDRIKNVLFVVD